MHGMNPLKTLVLKKDCGINLAMFVLKGELQINFIQEARNSEVGHFGVIKILANF